MSAANVIQLRQLLAEKFPGLRLCFDESPAANRACWPTGLQQIDERLHGFPRGAMTEIVSEKPGRGSALLMRALLTEALRKNQLVALIDGADSLDVTQLGEDLSHLLWVRCRSAFEALKAADIILRDGNLPLVILDLAINPAAQLRKIPATTWYRFQRLIEQTPTVCIVLTPRAMISPAQARVVLPSSFSLAALEAEPEKLLHTLKMEVSELHRAIEPLASSA